MTDSKDDNKIPAEAEVPTLDPEELLLAALQKGDQNETAIELLKQEHGKLVLVQHSTFRIRGTRAEDGTIECQLTDRNIPIRIAAGNDIAVGPRQIQRQKQKQEAAAKAKE